MTKFIFRILRLTVLVAALAGNALYAQGQWGLNIIYPNEGSTFMAPANLVLMATNVGFEDLIGATNPPPIEVVQFFANSNLVATTTNVLGTNVPNAVWTGAPAGTYTLVAVGSVGTNEATSQPVTITVNPAPSNPQTNPPPDSTFATDIISPANGTVFTAPANVVLMAGNLGSEDLIGETNPLPNETIRIFANSNLIATFTNVLATNLPVATWQNVPSGVYTLVAVGSIGTNIGVSQPVTITVNPAPSNPGTNTPNSGFVVSLTSPTNAQVYTAPADIQLEDFVDGTSPPITALIQFYANSNIVGSFTNGPGTNRSSVLWTNVPAGTYGLIAVATAKNGVETSMPVTIIVNGAPSNPDTNPPSSGPGFSVSIVSPTNVEIFQAPATIQLEDSVSGVSPTSVETVQFFANSNLIATVTNGAGTNVSSTTWTSVASGNYMLTAVATDDSGSQAFSQPVMISVGDVATNPPTPPPPGTNAALGISIGYPENGQVYTPPATIQLYALATEASADEVVQFFANSNLIATVTNLPGSNVFVANWTNIPVGLYGLTAVVSNSVGVVAASPPVMISVSVDTNPPVFMPFGTLASPTNGSIYAAPADIGLEETWSAGDPTASATVQFYANSNLIATVGCGPGTNTCFAAWTNVAAGSYSLTAVLTYGSATGSSAPISITVSDDSTNGPVANVVARSQLPVVGVFPGNATIGAPVSHVTGGCVYLSIGATSGMAYSLERSTDLVNWTPVFTNKAVSGEAQYVAPSGYSASQFYRIVPAKPSSN